MIRKHEVKNGSGAQTTSAARAKIRTFVLDLFPLTDMVAESNRTFADVLHWSALVCLLSETARPTELRNLRELVSVAGDLGYIDVAVAEYLDREIGKLMADTGIMSSEPANDRTRGEPSEVV